MGVKDVLLQWLLHVETHATEVTLEELLTVEEEVMIKLLLTKW